MKLTSLNWYKFFKINACEGSSKLMKNVYNERTVHGFQILFALK